MLRTRAQGGGTILTDRHGLPGSYAVRLPGIRQGLQALRGFAVSPDYAVFVMAPSIMTPELMNFQNATMSLRAKATMVDFFMRPPFSWTRALNHLVNPDAG